MVTIFTSIYNRKYIIEKLYNSLKVQSDHNFEWIIVDDGSTDDVFPLLEKWKKEENNFSIKLKQVQNGGKHRAINLGVQMASHEAFYIVDSDDFIPEDAISFINIHFPSISENKGFAGIAGLKYSYKRNACIGGSTYFEQYVDATNLEREQYGLLGDKAEVYKTSVLKKYPFPEFPNENFLTEDIVWNRIAKDGLRLRWYNKKLYYCEYLEDGLTNQGNDCFIRNPRGWARRITDAESYKFWTRERVDSEKFFFYEMMYDNFTEDEMCELLHLDTSAYKIINTKYMNILTEIKRIFKKNNWNSVVIYGFGTWGNRLLVYLKKLDIAVSYVIDKDPQKVRNYPAYRLEEDLPDTSNVCIAMKRNDPNVRVALQEKLIHSSIWKLNEVVKEF